MNLYKSSILVAALAMGFAFTSCDNDDDLVFSGKPVANAEMREFLKGKGYQFNEAGNLLMDAKVAATDSLDLTGSKLTDLSDLVLFPNLKYVDLSDNGYGPVYDFANLPKNIQGVDLTGNEIYDFEGLVDAKVENDELKTTILRNFSSLQLPASAKFNVEDLMPFYMQNQTDGKKVNMTMENEKGELVPYTTKRTIVNDEIRAILMNLYPSVFDGEELNIAKPMDANDEGKNLIIQKRLSEYAANSYEGIEYFVNNPYYKKFGVFVFGATTDCKLNYLMPGGNINTMNIPNLQFDVNLSKAAVLGSLYFENNEVLTELDLTNTAVGKLNVTQFEGLSRCDVKLYNCVNIEEITFAKGLVGHAADFHFLNMPKLKALDLSEFKAFQSLWVLALPKCDSKMPATIASTDTPHKVIEEDGVVNFAITKDVLADEDMKTFFEANKETRLQCYTRAQRKCPNPDDFVEF